MRYKLLLAAAAFLASVPAASAASPSKPEIVVTRMAFLQMVTQTQYAKDIHTGCFKDITFPPNNRFTLLFRDVPTNYPLAAHVCVGIKMGLIVENRDGNFRPNDPVNLAEASKILYKAYGVGPLDRQNIAGSPWYSHYIYDLRKAGIIPTRMKNPGMSLTVKDVAELMTNANGGKAVINMEDVPTITDEAPGTDQPLVIGSFSQVSDSPEEIVRTHRITGGRRYKEAIDEPAPPGIMMRGVLAPSAH